jgi:hypothetical protein
MPRHSSTSRRAAAMSGLEGKLAKYALAGGAVLGAPFAAHADTIFYSGPLNQTISGNGGSLTVNFLGSASMTLSTRDTPNSGFFENFASLTGASTTFVANAGNPAALNFGDIISTANAT